jgi:hypothetical protein
MCRYQAMAYRWFKIGSMAMTIIVNEAKSMFTPGNRRVMPPPLPERPDPDVNEILPIADDPRGVDQETGTDGRTAPAMSPVRRVNSPGESS